MVEGSQDLPHPTTGRPFGRRWRWVGVYFLPIALGSGGAWMLVGGAGEARVEIESRPISADVFLNGRWRGTTPLTLERVAHGRHHLRLAKAGYLHFAEALYVKRHTRRVATQKALPTLKASPI